MVTAAITGVAITMVADITVNGITAAIIVMAGTRTVDTTHGVAAAGMAGVGEVAEPSS